MNLFDFDIVKAEKNNAVQRYNHFRTIAKLFRLFELCVALVFFMWTCTRLPFVVKIFGEYFRRFVSVLVTPLFVFVLCNAIIVSLLAKSGQNNENVNNIENELYEEFIKNSTIDRTRSESENDALTRETDEVKYQDKQIISEVNATVIEDEIDLETQSHSDSDSDSDSVSVSDFPKAYKRSQSEKIERQCLDKDVRELRRAETEKCLNVTKSDEEYWPESFLLEEELSSEEFNRTVEDFIARQWRFRRQESVSVVLHNQS